MTRWRVLVGAVLLLVVGLPLALPFVDLLRHPSAWHAWSEAPRLLLLARNTFSLVACTLALALPAGIVTAILLYRTDLPLRRALRFATVLTLFVPLPLLASGWQAALGAGGWLPLAAWSTPPPGDPDLSPSGIAWKPWAQGIGAAAWIHALAGLPWVILLVGQGLRWVERELEEDALLAAGPGRVLFQVTLPRSRAALGAAALWIALQTATEITVTDMMQVRTFAEEVYSQFVRPEPGMPVGGAGELARAAAVSLPQVLLGAMLVAWAVGRWQRALPPAETLATPPLLFRLGHARWLVLAAILAGVGVLLGVPLASLVWKAGLDGSPETWSAGTIVTAIQRGLEAQEQLVGESLGSAGLAGLGAAGLALLACWLAAESRWFRLGVLVLVIAAWTLPAPLVGIGLKEVINRLIGLAEQIAGSRNSELVRGVRRVLYDGPSLVPVVWAYLVRLFPFAVAVLWPVVRLIPRELRDAARIDGATPVRELAWVVWPMTRAASMRAALAVAVLALGELSASKLAAAPGSHLFAHEVFTRMHFGVTSDLAATCLVLLAAVAQGGALVGLAGLIPSRTRPPLDR